MRLGVAATLTSLAASAPALAREPFEDAFFVRHGASGVDMLKDRATCITSALDIGSSASAYTDPAYGALNAMSHELDADALHDGGLRKRLYHAVFVDCMKRQGWTPLDPTPEDARAIGHASIRHPEALDAWLKAHEPAAPSAISAASAPPPSGSAQAALR